jgi:hypothetical protein
MWVYISRRGYEEQDIVHGRLVKEKKKLKVERSSESAVGAQDYRAQ